MIRARKSRRWPMEKVIAQGDAFHAQPWARLFPRQWQQLVDRCCDEGSRVRLSRLRDRFDTQKWPMAHSSVGEVDVASLFVQAGFSLAFLEETGTRTADLECYWDHDRCFVEVTVMRPSVTHAKLSFAPQEYPADSDGTAYERRAILEQRLLARMVEKARQLDRYCAPIVLAITVPSWPPQPIPGADRKEPLDVQQLAGVSVGALAGLPALSALLLTFWDAEPQERRSTVRLADVYCMTRIPSEVWRPRIRMLVVNPFARYPLGKKERAAIERVL